MSLLAGGILAESPEAAESARRADEEFEAQENVDFGKNAGKLGESLGYKPFVAPQEEGPSRKPTNPEDTPLQLIPESQESIPENNIDEQIYAPLIDRLVGDSIISPEQGSEIKSQLNGENFREVIESLDFMNAEIQQLIIDRWGEFNNEESANEFQETFQKDFAGDINEFKNGKGELSDRVSEALDIVGVHYMSGREQNPDIEALNMAFEISANNVLNDLGTAFHRTEQFQENLRVVKDPESSFQERTQSLADMLSELYTNAGSKGGKRLKDKQMAQKKEALKNAGIEEQYNKQLQTLRVARESGKSQSIKKAELALQETIEQVKDLSEGEIGSFDITMETGGTESGETQQKTI